MISLKLIHWPFLINQSTFTVGWIQWVRVSLGPGLCVVLLLRQICWYEVCVNKEKTSILHRLCILLVPILFQIRPLFLCVLILHNCPKSFIATGCHLLIQEGENPWVEAPASSLDGGGNFLGLWGWRSVLNSRCKSPFDQERGNLMDVLWVHYLLTSGLQILSIWS